jgi:phospholipid transport system substrate-binding protein
MLELVSGTAKMTHDTHPIGRRGLLSLTVTAFVASIPWQLARAGTTSGASPTTPIKQLNAALLGIMKSAATAPFIDRYRALAPTIDQVFDLDAVLERSIGLSWTTMPAAQKADLATAFRRYTVSSYVANFNSYNGQSFQVLPDVRNIGDGEIVVQSKMLRADASPLELDYVMQNGPTGWHVVDVLTDGSISRVAVQRSDFRALLRRGGPPALVAGLESKYANLSGGMPG